MGTEACGSVTDARIEKRAPVVDTRMGAACPQGSVCRVFDQSVRMFADRPAVVDGDRSLTYRALGERAEAIARALRPAGVAPGDRVAMFTRC